MLYVITRKYPLIQGCEKNSRKESRFVKTITLTLVLFTKCYFISQGPGGRNKQDPLDRPLGDFHRKVANEMEKSFRELDRAKKAYDRVCYFCNSSLTASTSGKGHLHTHYNRPMLVVRMYDF